MHCGEKLYIAAQARQHGGDLDGNAP